MRKLLDALRVHARALGRWWLVGLAFFGLNIPLLYVLHDRLMLSLAVATLVGGEIATLLRFLINDRWVFAHRRPTWRRALEYHGVVLSSFVIWWAVTNSLPQWGVHYLVASVVGTACSVGWSMVTNFMWVWRPRVTVADRPSPQ
jgi:putative flippase GtrA